MTKRNIKEYILPAIVALFIRCLWPGSRQYTLCAMLKSVWLSSVGISDFLSFILFSHVANAIYDVRVADIKTKRDGALVPLALEFFGVAKTQIRLKINVRFLSSTTIHTTHSIYTFYYWYHDYYCHLNYDWLSQCCDGRCSLYMCVLFFCGKCVCVLHV